MEHLSFSSAVFGTVNQVSLKEQFRILIIDDEPRILNSLCEILKSRNFEIVTGSSGREALEHLEKSQFDLVILDMNLSDMSGHEIMDFINAHNEGTDVIVISGNSDISSAIGALKRGAFDYLRKPYAREELLNTVDNAIKRRVLEADNRRFSWQIENSERTYRYLVDHSPDIIYTLDENGLFTFLNARTSQLLGFTFDELIGKHYSVLVHDDDLELARYVFKERRVSERSSTNVELRLKCNKGIGESRIFENSFLTISFNSIGIYSPDGKQSNTEYFGTYGVARDITERKRVEEMIAYQAYHDILTDLPNRALLNDRLELSIIQSQRNKTKLAIMFIDLDRFKLVNDTLGHVKGDDLLQQASSRLKDCLRRGDTLARIGGDEFVLIIPELKDKTVAGEIADKFLTCLQQPFFLGSNEAQISASIGIALYPDDALTMEELIRHADIAMYSVKARGKNGHSFYDNSMIDASYQKLELDQALRKALEHGELEMFYQPQIDVSSGLIVGAEALMRWNHPKRGFLTPGDFLPFAEENGLIIPISDWMLNAICADLARLNKTGGTPIKFSLNLSPQYLERGDFFNKLKSTLQHYGVPPRQIEVEITENICIRNPEHAISQLKNLNKLGVSIAIDDFGTGYSSLSYLQKFSIHTIKIDQSFVKEIHRENTHYPIIQAIISIAKGLGLNLVAEGVETETQARYLERADCKIMQGYFYHKPLPLKTLTQMLSVQSAIS